MAEDDISPRMKKMLEKGRIEARKRVIERGIVQFRADPELMAKLLEISEQRRIPLGTMVRNWTADRLDQEQSQLPASDVNTLVERISDAVVSKLNTHQKLKKRHL